MGNPKKFKDFPTKVMFDKSTIKKNIFIVINFIVVVMVLLEVSHGESNGHLFMKNDFEKNDVRCTKLN